jgi:hypothetical protein
MDALRRTGVLQLKMTKMTSQTSANTIKKSAERGARQHVVFLPTTSSAISICEEVNREDKASLTAGSDLLGSSLHVLP